MSENDTTIVLVGLMGAGKTSIGSRLAKRLDLAFIDADEEIVLAAGCPIEDIFEVYGEAAFRDVEARVIARLLDGAPCVLATGGGAFMTEKTRELIAEKAVSVWLKASLDTLVRRTARRHDRPLLKGGDPAAILQGLIDKRYPVYAEAQMIVETGNESMDETVTKIVQELRRRDLAAADAEGDDDHGH